MAEIVNMADYKASQGHLEFPYGECSNCGGDAFGAIMDSWDEDAGVGAMRCYSCNSVIELYSIVVECTLE